MRYINSKCIILYHKSINENDKFVTVYSEALGKIKIFAKGLRKIKSKLCSSLQPLNYIIIQLYKNPLRDYYIVTGTELIKDFNAIKKEIRKLMVSFQIIELIDNLITEQEKSKDVFKLLLETLVYLESFNEEELVFIFFALRLFSLEGYRLMLDRCVECDKLIDSQFKLSLRKGGLVCSKCMNEFPYGQDVSLGVKKYLEKLLNSDINYLNILKIDKKLKQELKNIVYTYITENIGKVLNSSKVKEEIKQ